MIKRTIRPVFSLCLVLTISGLMINSGCNNKPAGPKTVRAGGIVTYKGLPVGGANVAFLGDGTSQPAMAITEANGEFILTTTTPGDGAVPGEHQVTVSKIISAPKKADAPASGSMEAAAKAAQAAQSGSQEAPKSMSMLPEQYSRATSSGLHFKVEEGKENNFKIELQD